MDVRRLPTLDPYISRCLGDPGLDAEERAKVDNVVLDERPPMAGVELYTRHLDGHPVADLDDWHDWHNRFLDEEILIDPSEKTLPWTFRPENNPNRLRSIDPRINLIRVEEAAWPCSLSGISAEQLRERLKAFQRGDGGASDFLAGFTRKWNNGRDQRPLFATTELEVADLFAGATTDWAEQLRDRLGLGHYLPGPAHRPVEVIVMRYTVQEVLDGQDNGHPAVPTVLDGGLNPYFFPSPMPGPEAEPPYYGHTLNLAAVVHENDYRIGVELLHPRIEYRPAHLYKVGVIDRPFAMPLEQARRFHLPWLCLYTDRDDFGAKLP